MPIEKIEQQGTLYAFIVRRDTSKPDSVQFLTPDEFPLQLGLIERPSGYAFRPHIHRDMRYDVNTTQEVLYVERGRVRVTIYTPEWEVIRRTEMTAGDILFSVTGGHGFEVLEDVRLIEVKQGPYPGDHYAKRFQA
jgi:hypothetical protein